MLQAFLSPDPHIVRRTPPHVGFETGAPPALWVCDVNGVLVDSTALVQDAFAATAARFGFVCGTPQFQLVKGLSLVDAYGVLQPGGDPFAARACHLAYLRERAADVSAFSGVRDTLLEARASGIRIGAATSHGEIAEAFLVTTGLYPLIDCLVTQEEVKRPKPYPDSILRVLTLLGAPRADGGMDAVHIGDTPEDIWAGKAAGIRTVGVTSGVSPEAQIRAAEPDFVIDTFHQMRSLLLTSRGHSCATSWD